MNAPRPAPSAAPGGVPRLDAAAAVRLSGLFLLSRALVLAAAALSRLAVPPGPFPDPGLSHSWLGRFLAWDSAWYLAVAKVGYAYDPHGESSIGFYPLLPLLIRAGAALGLDPAVAGYGVSHLALAGAAVLLWRLAALETGSARTADRAAAFLLFSPGAVWFGLVYSESLFLVTTLGCLLAARRGRWLLAGACGLAAALTRTPGVLLAGFLILEAGQQWLGARRRAREEGLPAPAPRPFRKTFLRPALAVLGPVLGQAGFLIYQQAAFGDWRAQQRTVASGWNPDGILPPWTALRLHWRWNDPFFTAVADPLLLVALAAGTASFFTLRRAGYGALVFALAALYVSSTNGDALTRYLSTMVPVYLVLAQLAERSPLLETAVLVFSAMLLTLLTALLVNGYRII